MPKAPSSHGPAVVKAVTVGPMTAKLTQLATGIHAGSWKITYKDLSGNLCIGGIRKSEAKAKAAAIKALTDLMEKQITPTDAEASLLLAIRKADIHPDTLLPYIADLRQVHTATIQAAVEQFLTREVEDAGYSLEQKRDYKTVLHQLRDHFPGEQLTAITLPRLESWADGWGVGPKRANNKRTILTAFWTWATARDYCRKNVAASLPRRRVPRRTAHQVLTPAEFARLLVHCPDTYLPWLALSGFAGLRGIEIYGRPDDRTSGLHWDTIDWEKKTILLHHHTVKQTSRSRARKIAMSDALIDWLSPWRKATGPVFPPALRLPTGGTGSLSSQLGKHIGGWKSNALRASRASYRLAQTQSIATVTLEMGHTQDILIGTYLNPRFEEDAATWFSLDRKNARSLADAAPPAIVSISA